MSEDERKETNQPILMVLIIMIGVVSIVGLGGLIGLLALLLFRGVRDELIVMLTFGYLLTLISSMFMISRQISKFTGEKTDNKGNKKDKKIEDSQPDLLPELSITQLKEAQPQPFSVTDQTTRVFDKSLVNRE